MRELAIGNSIVECQKAIDRFKSRGWKQLTEIKLDDSIYQHLRYVCVMEHTKAKGEPKGFNSKGFL